MEGRRCPGRRIGVAVRRRPGVVARGGARLRVGVPELSCRRRVTHPGCGGSWLRRRADRDARFPAHKRLRPNRSRPANAISRMSAATRRAYASSLARSCSSSSRAAAHRRSYSSFSPRRPRGRRRDPIKRSCWRESVALRQKRAQTPAGRTATANRRARSDVRPPFLKAAVHGATQHPESHARRPAGGSAAFHAYE